MISHPEPRTHQFPLLFPSLPLLLSSVMRPAGLKENADYYENSGFSVRPRIRTFLILRPLFSLGTAMRQGEVEATGHSKDGKTWPYAARWKTLAASSTGMPTILSEPGEPSFSEWE